MIYIFHFRNVSLENIRAFVAFAETLKSYRHCNIEWRKNLTQSEGSVAILCDKNDYEECFYYLKNKDIFARVEKTPVKLYKRRNGK